MKSIRVLGLVLLLLLAPMQWLGAQSALRLQNYSYELSEHMVTDIRQDERGFLWFSTWNGLHRFDGYRFKNYKTYPGEACVMTSNRIMIIRINQSGNIWCRDYERNVYLFNPEEERFYDLNRTLDTLYNETFTFDEIICTPDYGSYIVAKNELFVIDEKQFDPFTGRGVTRLSRSMRKDGTKIGKVVDVVTPTGGQSWIVGSHALATTQQTLPYPDKHTVTATVATDDKIYLLTGEGHLGIFTPERKSILWEPLPMAVKGGNCLVRINSDQLAIGTTKGALLYTMHTHRFAHIDPNSSGIDTSTVTDIYCDSHHNLWLYTDRNGVVRYHLPSGELQHLQTPKEDIPDGSVSSTILCFEDKQGTLWVVPRGGGLSWYDAKERCLRTYQTDPSRPETRYTPITSLYFLDRQGNLWYSGISGLFRLSFSDNTTTYRLLDPGFDTRAVMTDLKGRLWVANKKGLVRIYRPDKSLAGYLGRDGRIHSTPTYLNDNVYCFLEDPNGVIWMGTRLRGLLRLEPRGEDRYHLTRYLHDEKDPYSLSDNSIYDLFVDSHHRLWACTYGGGINLVCTEGERIRFVHHNNELRNFPIEACPYTRTIIEKRGVLLVGTTNGLITFDSNFSDPATIRFHHNTLRPNDSSCLPANDVHAIFTDSRSVSYVMSFTGGVSRITSSDLLSDRIRFENYNIKDGLSSELAHTMMEDHSGKLWIIYENAIDRFDPLTNTIESYGDAQRIYTEAHPTFHGDDLVVATNDGLAYIRTRDLQKSDYVPSIAFSALRLQGTEEERMIDHLDTLTLAPEERDIQIHFAALDYADPEAIEYRFRMTGLETEWNRSKGSQPAVYTNLPVGEYTFEICSTNSEGVWAENRRTMAVVVTPTFWETPWAIVLICGSILLFIFGAIQLRLHIFRLRTTIDVEKQLANIKLRFFTNVSHELRTPLTLIASPVDEVIAREPLSETGLHQMKIVQRSTQQMLRLINQILDFRKIEHGKMRLLIEQTDLHTLLQPVVENFNAMAEQNHHDYTIRLPEEELYGWVDRDKVEKICFNLLSNAFKFTPEGRGILFEASADRHNLHILVSDEGVGMTAEQRKKLFVRFENTLGRTALPSSGIGLSLVKELLDLMQGTVEVESTPNVGTCFSVHVPINRAHYTTLEYAEFVVDEPQQLGAEEAILPLPAPDNGGEKPTLLVVDDNADLRYMLTTILAAEFRVVTAGNGAEGLEMARKELPDLILSDVMMPVVDGLEMVKSIKEDRDLCHLPIVMLSAKSAIEDRIRGLETGIDDYITKPFVGSYLKVRLRTLLAKHRELRERYRTQLTSPDERPQTDTLDSIAPQQPQLVPQDEAFMQQLLAVIEQHMDNADMTIEEFAREVNMAHSTFYNKIKALLGVTPVEFIREMRLKRGCQLLATGNYDVSTVSYMVGFSDPRYFSKCFKKRFGISPSQWTER